MNFIKGKSKKGVLLIILFALIITGLNAILPMYTSAPIFISSNIIPAAVISATLGPIVGAIYAALASIILNNIGMGSGTIIYTLIFQILEAFLIGLVWYKESDSISKNIIKYIVSVIAFTIVVKPLSFAIFYIFNKEYIGGVSFFEYFSNAYTSFIQNNFSNTILMYRFSFLILLIIKYIVNYFNKK